jgi:hypothetical protein
MGRDITRETGGGGGDRAPRRSESHASRGGRVKRRRRVFYILSFFKEEACTFCKKRPIPQGFRFLQEEEERGVNQRS